VASDELDSLFAAPPTEFIAERKRIAAALKSAGRRDEAKSVEKIPRPSLAVWTVNQIARRDPALVRHLVAITDRLRSADAAAYAGAAVEHRQTLADLRRRAAEILAEAGQEAGLHLVQRVIANLRAAAGSGEKRVALEQGRLTHDVEEQDVVSLFGAAEADGPAPARRGHTPPPTEAPAKAAPAKAAAAARAEERARAKEIAAAEKEVKRLRDAETAARKNVDRAERAVAAAQESLAAAEARLTEERTAAEKATEALAEAEAAVSRLTGA
jgi:hypothetical protein